MIFKPITSLKGCSSSSRKSVTERPPSKFSHAGNMEKKEGRGRGRERHVRKYVELSVT